MPKIYVSLLALALVFLAACEVMTDPATRLAYDLRAGANRLGTNPGATLTLQHHTPSRRGQCEGPYRVQFDKAGALVIWCKDESGETISSHSTSYHRSYVKTSGAFTVDKRAGSTLKIGLVRRGGKAVIVEVK
ncbi:hypothetical protein [Marinimicrobium sp. ABcell2]|uniref:hypothetical protein n=1 Tax=Marinimicrobium sp. ABcell2 TaxID=3069751 RepID=UPI0027B4703F|nr:hypothetical protein [Marinimicrobium sp. ABcell2]MDQ2078373.1 hypothetical protein [Marinimicrobium sp. ABcell2]